MLRKIKSYSFLSPKKEPGPAQPATSPIRVYGMPPVSPLRCKTFRSKLAASHVCSACLGCMAENPSELYDRTSWQVVADFCYPEILTCPICLRPHSVSGQRIDSDQPPRRSPSDYRGNTPGRRLQDVDHILVEDQESLVRPHAKANQILSLDVQLRCDYEVVGLDACDALLLLEVQALYSSTSSLSAEEGSVANVMIVLDFRSSLSAKQRNNSMKVVAARIISLLRPYDTVGVITTIKGDLQAKTVFTCSKIAVAGQQMLQNIVLDANSDKSDYDNDPVPSLQYAAELLGLCPVKQAAHIIFVSDNIDLTLRDLQSISHTLQANNLALHSVGLGNLVNDTALRALAHCSKVGIHLSIYDLSEVKKLISHIICGSPLDPLTNISLSIQLFENAAIREIKYSELALDTATPQRFRLVIPRLGPCESRQIFVAIRLPSISLDPRLRVNSLAKDDPESLTNSLRIAELEYLIQSMPSRLASCTVSYNHPLLLDVETIRRAPVNVNLRRTQLETHISCLDVLGMDIRRSVLHALKQLFRHEAYEDQHKVISNLRTSVQSIQAYCARFDVPLSTFEDLLSDISSIRSEVSTRLTQTMIETTPSNRAIPSSKYSSHTQANRRQSAKIVYRSDIRPSNGPTNEPISHTVSPNRSVPGGDAGPFSDPLGVKVSNLQKPIRTPLQTQKSIRDPSSYQDQRRTTPETNHTDRLRGAYKPDSISSEQKSNGRGKSASRYWPSEPPKSTNVLYSERSEETNNVRRVRKERNEDSHKDHNSSKNIRDLFGMRKTACVIRQHKLCHSNRSDVAKTIWKSHKQERGELSILSDDCLDDLTTLLAESRTMAQPQSCLMPPLSNANPSKKFTSPAARPIPKSKHIWRSPSDSDQGCLRRHDISHADSLACTTPEDSAITIQSNEPLTNLGKPALSPANLSAPLVRGDFSDVYSDKHVPEIHERNEDMVTRSLAGGAFRAAADFEVN